MITMLNLHLEIEENDFPEYLSWYQIEIKLKEIKKNFRLPTKSEFQKIYQEFGSKNKDQFSNSYYWCTENDGITALQFNMHSGFFDPHNDEDHYNWEKTDKQPVRFVRSI